MKLHLGCGKRFIPGFVHIDAIDYKHVDHVATIDKLSFIPDNSVDLIYNCHVLEHFKRRDVQDVLKEWQRVLKPGGCLRTAVPDFEALAQLYVDNKNIKTYDTSNIITVYAFPNIGPCFTISVFLEHFKSVL